MANFGCHSEISKRISPVCLYVTNFQSTWTMETCRMKAGLKRHLRTMLVIILPDGKLPALPTLGFRSQWPLILDHQPKVGRRGICQPKQQLFSKGNGCWWGWASESQMCLPNPFMLSHSTVLLLTFTPSQLPGVEQAHCSSVVTQDALHRHWAKESLG